MKRSFETVRCFLDPAEWPAPDAGAELRLSPEESRHLLRVLRMGTGDPVEVFDGAGRSAEGHLAAVENHSAIVCAESFRRDAATGPRRILAQALVKGDKADLIVRKAVELGLDRMAWFDAERSVVRLDPARGNRRIARWRAVAIQAAKQCGRSRVPEIVRFGSVAALCASRAARETWFVCSLDVTAPPARERLGAGKLRDADGVCMAIGPEGDFTDEEEATLRGVGAQPLSLGPRVLRTETAAIYAMAVLAYELD